MPMTMVNYKNYTNKLGTFYRNSKEDMELLANLRKMVTNLNKDLRNAKMDYQFYVKCQGRLGKNNPNAYKYRGRYLYAVKLEDAERMDAYVYRRWS